MRTRLEVTYRISDLGDHSLRTIVRDNFGVEQMSGMVDATSVNTAGLVWFTGHDGWKLALPPDVIVSVKVIPYEPDAEPEPDEKTPGDEPPASYVAAYH